MSQSPKIRFAIVLTISVSVFILMAPLGGYSLSLKCASCLIMYCISAFLFLYLAVSKANKYWYTIILIAPVTLIYIPVHFLDMSGTLLSLPTSLTPFLGVCFGWAIFKFSLKYKLFITICVLFLALWIEIWGYKYWLNYVNFGTFTSMVNEPLLPFKFTDKRNLIIDNDHFRDKIIVLDFWNMSCGVCYRKFPTFNSLSKKYKNNQKVSFYSVNIPLKNDNRDSAKKIMANLGYQFENFYGDLHTPAIFKVTAYPTVLVIKDSQVIFRGDIDKVDKLLLNYIE